MIPDVLLGSGSDFDLNAVRRRVAALAQEGMYVGTSSWKYEGWLGLLYDEQCYLHRGKVSKKRFQENCLAEYAQTFKTVSVDAGYYQFPTEESLKRLCDPVPDDFRFSFKVTDEITLKHFHSIERHGSRAGQANPNFLNTDLFAEKFLGPCSAFKEKIGVLMFEFSTFQATDYARGREFVDDLDRFLERLPNDWQFGVEVRNESFLRPEYFQCLRRHGVAHIYNSWNRMPPVEDQMKLSGSETTDFVAARFLLKPGRSYSEAVKLFSPYRETKEPNLAARKTIRELLKKKKRRNSFVFVNNRLEGNALKTIQAAT
jgi:uncharacterized protein YecE (DUF72 family)